MFDWDDFTLFLYILMRMAGFVMFNPIFGRNGIPRMFQSGMILALSVTVYTSYSGLAVMPGTLLELILRLLLELGVGVLIAVIMHFFFLIPEQAGEVVDTQMGMSMAKTYDPSAQASLTTTASLLRILMTLVFFAANGHLTLLRLMLTSGDVIPFGAASFGDLAANYVVEVFVECILLSVKLALPILAAELLGQMGMGILMKAIPQINVFAINIELKVIIGLVLLYLLLDPISTFLLDAEASMLSALRQALTLVG